MLGLQFWWKLRKLGLGGKNFSASLILLDGMAGVITAKNTYNVTLQLIFLVAYHTF
jgi:hypothetical protein